MAAESVDEVLALYDGEEARAWYDEAVTELDHALQSAALATAEDATPELIAAALLHDVGHLVINDNVPIDHELRFDHHHERAGAVFLAPLFGPEVTVPIRLHVAAKRYLCAVDAAYGSTLSASSVRSLAIQGGPMSAEEVEAFEGEPHLRAAVQVRRWDDRAKVAGAEVPRMETYRELLESLT